MKKLKCSYVFLGAVLSTFAHAAGTTQLMHAKGEAVYDPGTQTWVTYNHWISYFSGGGPNLVLSVDQTEALLATAGCGSVDAIDPQIAKETDLTCGVEKNRDQKKVDAFLNEVDPNGQKYKLQLDTQQGGNYYQNIGSMLVANYYSLPACNPSFADYFEWNCSTSLASTSISSDLKPIQIIKKSSQTVQRKTSDGQDGCAAELNQVQADPNALGGTIVLTGGGVFGHGSTCRVDYYELKTAN